MGENNKRIKSVQSTFRIINKLKELDGATISELTDELDLVKSTIHCHIATLRDEGYVMKEGNEYVLSHYFLEIGSYTRTQSDLYQHGRPKIDDLAEETKESSWLVAEQHGKGIYLYNSAGERSVKTLSRIGLLSDLHVTAAGKCILAYSSEEKVDRVIEEHGLPRMTENTITDREELYQELEVVREQGYSLNREESLKGIHAVGSPVIDADGSVVGAISVSGPANRLIGERFESELPMKIRGIANEIELNIAHDA